MATKIVDAHIGKRALTAIFDLFFAFLLGIGIFSLSSVAMTSTQEAASIKEEMTSYQLASGLYYKDGEGNIKYYDNLISYELYQEKLLHYYTVFLKDEAPVQYRETHDVYWYNVFILGLDDELSRFTQAELNSRVSPANVGKTIWEYPVENEQKLYQNPGIPVLSLYKGATRDTGLSDTGKKITLDYYYTPDKQNCYYNAASDLYHRPFYLSTVEAYENRATVYPLLIAIPTSLVVFYLALPLIFRDGQTLGKKIMKLAVIRQDEYASTRPQILLRQLPSIAAVTILFIFLPWSIAAMISLGLLIVSYALAIFTPHHRAVHDYIAFSRVVDDKESIFHKKGETEAEPIDPLFPNAQAQQNEGEHKE